MPDKKTTGSTPKPEKKKAGNSKKPALASKGAKSKGKLAKTDLLADQIFLLTQDLDPSSQGILHRFSLRLTALVATGAVKWLGVIVIAQMIAIIVLSFASSGNTEIISIDAHGRVAKVQTRESEKLRYRDSQVTNWANDTIIESFDFSWQNYDRRLEKVTNERYTEYGKSSFQAALRPLIADVTRLQASVYAESKGPAVITNIKRGAKGKIWTITKPVLLTLTPTNGEKVQNDRKITMKVYQVNEWESLKGLAVNQVIQGSN
jgi:hypothetical protein